MPEYTQPLLYAFLLYCPLPYADFFRNTTFNYSSQMFSGNNHIHIKIHCKDNQCKLSHSAVTRQSVVTNDKGSQHCTALKLRCSSDAGINLDLCWEKLHGLHVQWHCKFKGSSRTATCNSGVMEGLSVSTVATDKIYKIFFLKFQLSLLIYNNLLTVDMLIIRTKCGLLKVRTLQDQNMFHAVEPR